MNESWPHLVTSAAAQCTSALAKGEGHNWSRHADGLEWTCRHTLDHIAFGVVGYAGLLIAQPTDRYITLFTSLDKQAPIPACLEGIRIAGAILGSAVRESRPDVRAWHPWGHSDGSGFAAMGIIEMIVHSHDIAHALGVDWKLPDDLCLAAIERVFPDAPTGNGPADTLLWCTGRTALPGLDRQDTWQWNGTRPHTSPS